MLLFCKTCPLEHLETTTGCNWEIKHQTQLQFNRGDLGFWLRPYRHSRREIFNQMSKCVVKRWICVLGSASAWRVTLLWLFCPGTNGERDWLCNLKCHRAASIWKCLKYAANHNDSFWANWRRHDLTKRNFNLLDVFFQTNASHATCVFWALGFVAVDILV